MDWNTNNMNSMGASQIGSNNFNGMTNMSSPQGFNNYGFYNMPGNNQKTQPTYIPGRMVGAELDITAQEVPMDGNFGTFVQKDLQKVYLKAWMGDGKIHTNEYILISSDGVGVNGEPAQNPMNLILERLDRIENQLKEQKRPFNPNYKGKKPYNKPENQEGTQNE